MRTLLGTLLAISITLAFFQVRNLFEDRARHGSLETSGTKEVADIASRIQEHRADGVKARPSNPILFSGDASTLRDNLRRAGAPESVVRAVVSALIDRQFTDKEKLISPYVPGSWWEYRKTDTSPETLLALSSLRREKIDLKQKILGPDPVIDAESPFGSKLRPEVRQQFAAVMEDYKTLLSAVRGPPGRLMLPGDLERITLVERAMSDDLAKFLNPDEIAAAKFLNSPAKQYIDRASVLFAPSSDELTILERLEPKRKSTMTADDQRVLEKSLQEALGDARYEEYAMARRIDFINLQDLVVRNGLPLVKVKEVFAIGMNVESKSSEIVANDAVSRSEKVELLKNLARDTRAEIHKSLGKEAADAYLISAEGWLSQIEQGKSIRFSPSGGWESRSTPPKPVSATPSAK